MPYEPSPVKATRNKTNTTNFLLWMLKKPGSFLVFALAFFVSLPFFADDTAIFVFLIPRAAIVYPPRAFYSYHCTTVKPALMYPGAGGIYIKAQSIMERCPCMAPYNPVYRKVSKFI